VKRMIAVMTHTQLLLSCHLLEFSMCRAFSSDIAVAVAVLYAVV